MARDHLDLLRPTAVFAAVVAEGGFRAAARALGASPPHVSHVVRDLEERLGVQLLYRSTRKLRLTDAGARFLDEAAPSLEALGAAIDGARGAAQALEGKLRVSAPTLFATPTFAAFLAAFQEENPKLELDVALDDVARDPIGDAIDLAIRVGAPKGDPRPARLLFRTEAILVGHPEIAGILRAPDDLAAHRFVAPSRLATSPLTLEEGEGGRRVPMRPRSVMVVDNDLLTRHLLRERAGFAVYPHFAIADILAAGQLARVLAPWRIGLAGAYALYSARRPALGAARAFVDAFRAHLAARRDANPAALAP